MIRPAREVRRFKETFEGQRFLVHEEEDGTVWREPLPPAAVDPAELLDVYNAAKGQGAVTVAKLDAALKAVIAKLG